MPGGQEVPQTRESQLRVAGLFLRRKAGKEFHNYISLFDYDPQDYEVLLRRWPSGEFFLHLGAFSGPVIAGEDPEVTLLRESNNWSRSFARRAGISDAEGMKGKRGVFISVHGGGNQVDPVSGKPLDLGVVLCYAVPVIHKESAVISHLPKSPEYPMFYSLGDLLRTMADSTTKIHPTTREMVASLDHWLREQHAVPGAINSLYAPNIRDRMKMFVMNPLFAQPPVVGETPNQSFVGRPNPLLSSTPFHGLGGEDSTLHETTAFTFTRLSEMSTFLEQPVDLIVKNPLFGSGLKLRKVNGLVVNEHFGEGEPDYQAVQERKGKWIVQVQGDGLPDWTELFPLHKFACEGDAEGVRRCLALGLSADEKDSDGWASMHYACWYGELDVVKVLVEDGGASIGIQNSSGSTPLHLAAGTGHPAVVSYLLKQRGIDRLKAALDQDGKSPLAVCLECKMNDWEETAQLLREAYRESSLDGPISPTLLSFSQQTPSIEDLLLGHTTTSTTAVGGNQGDLRYKGSLANLEGGEINTTTKKNKAKDKSAGQRQTVRRQRVSFMNGQHQVAHFFKGRETPAADVIQDLYRLIKLGREYHSLFALWISSKNLEIQLGDMDKPLKLMSTWKKLLEQYGSPTGKGNHSHGDEELPNFYLRRNVFFPPTTEKMVSDPLALEFLYVEAQKHVLSGYYPCSEEDALYLAGISMQIAYGDYNIAIHKPGFLKDKLDQVLPTHMASTKRRMEHERKILARYAEMSQSNVYNTELLYVSYLKHCWQWPCYGATFYNGVLYTKGTKLPSTAGRISRKSQVPVSIGVNTLGFHIVNRETNILLESLSFDGLEWDIAVKKHELVLYKKNRSVNVLIRSRQVALIYSLVTRMMEQYSGVVGVTGSRTSFTTSTLT